MVGRTQVMAQQALQPKDGGRAGHQQGAVRAAGRGVLDDMRVLVFDIADHHFQQVFQGEVAQDAAVFFHAQCQVGGAGAETLQHQRYRGLQRDQVGRAQQRAQIVGRMAAGDLHQQVLHVQDAEHFLAVAVEPRVAAVAALGELGHHVGQAHPVAERTHMVARAHQVAGHQFGQFQRVAHQREVLVRRAAGGLLAAHDELEFLA